MALLYYMLCVLAHINCEGAVEFTDAKHACPHADFRSPLIVHVEREFLDERVIVERQNALSSS